VFLGLRSRKNSFISLLFLLNQNKLDSMSWRERKRIKEKKREVIDDKLKEIE
jgi:hypothetical protein